MCIKNHKEVAHDIIKRGSIAILKRLLVSAKLLLPTSAVTKEKEKTPPHAQAFSLLTSRSPLTPTSMAPL